MTAKEKNKDTFKENESISAAHINRFLHTFGEWKDKEPKFRLSWSEDQRELRTGEFDVHANGIFLRTETGTREMAKYPYLRERYILEQWYPPELSFCPELPNSQYGSYEPIYVFEDGNGNRLPLNMKVVEMIMHAKFNQSESQKDKDCRMRADQDIKDKKEVEYFEDALELSSDIMSNLHFGEGIIVPKEYEGNSPNLKGLITNV